MADLDRRSEGNNYLHSELDSLRKVEVDPETVMRISAMREQIGRRLAIARKDGTVSSLEEHNFFEMLRDHSADDSKIKQIGEKVEQIISESKILLTDFSNNEFVDAEELALFKEMSLEEKRHYLAQIKRKISGLEKKLGFFASLVPGGAEKLKELTGVERAKFIEELNDRRANFAVYLELISGNENYFSRVSREQYMRQFAELSIPMQSDWIASFEVTQLRPRKELAKRFEVLPREVKAGISGFEELSRHEKEKLVDKLEQEVRFNELVDKSDDSRKVAMKSKEFAKVSFRAAPSALRADMLAMIKKHLAAEAELYNKFEKMPDSLKVLHPGFVDYEWEKKVQIIESVDKQNDVLRQQYAAMLDDDLRDRVISRGAMENLLQVFDGSELEVRQLLVSDFERTMKDHRDLKVRFEKEVPEDLRKTNQHFYEKSLQERMELFEKLMCSVRQIHNVVQESQSAQNPFMRQPEQGSNPQITMMKIKASELFSQGKFDQARTLYEAMLIMDPDNAGLKKWYENFLNEREKGSAGDLSFMGRGFDDQLVRMKSEKGMKEKLRRLNVARGIHELVKNSERQNSGIVDGTQKVRHLEDEKARDLNRELVKHSAGQVVLGKGGEKVRRVKKFDIEKVEAMNEVDLDGFQREVIDSRGKQGLNVHHHLQLVNSETGILVSAETLGKTQLVAAEKVVRAELAKRMRKLMSPRGGQVEKGLDQYIKARIDEDKLDFDLAA